MKNLLLSILIITAFAACNSKQKADTTERNIQLLPDPPSYNNNVFSDTPVTVKAQPLEVKVSPAPHVAIKTKAIKSVPAANSTVVSPVAQKPVIVPPVQTQPAATAQETPANTTVGNTGETGNSNSGTASTPTVEKKKGWSKAAQGAAIGGVTGAVGGAILSKKKGVGAVVGGVVGAAGGYIIGKGMDKKDGR